MSKSRGILLGCNWLQRPSGSVAVIVSVLFWAGASSAQVVEEPVFEPGVVVDPMAANSVTVPRRSPSQDYFSADFEAQRGLTPGYDFISTRDFEDAFVFPGTNAQFKIGGYVKLDAIQDFDAIDSQDFFDPGTIPVAAPPRTNSRFHARQTRLNIDTRWPSDFGPTRVFVEGDFFGDANSFRLRHAYGEVASFLAGQTWTTFTNHNALPQTIDNQRGVAGISTRRAQLRYTRELPWEDWKVAVALEDPAVEVDPPALLLGEARTPSPDFVARIRVSRDWGTLQVAGITRQLGFQQTGQAVRTTWGGGLNFTGWVNVLENDKWIFQIVSGEGIGSFRDLPDGALSSPTTLTPLHSFAWMTGYAHSWSERWTSNITYSASTVSNTAFQTPDSIHRTEYLAVNLVWNPADRLWTGIEYLHGSRTNLNGATGDANRLQIAFLFELP